MAYAYSAIDTVRKAKIIKNNLRKDGFYSSKLLCRVKVNSGASGIFNRSIYVRYEDTMVLGIIEINPIMIMENNVVENTDGTVRFTCKEDDATYLLEADELWYDYTIDASGLVSGTQYKLRNQKRDLFGLDRIFILKQVGELIE